MTTPDTPPEGEALERARQRARISQREAARRAGISETRWRQITAGHHIAGGVVVPDLGPAHTIARMAVAVGLTGAELAEAGRDDALAFLPIATLPEAGPETTMLDLTEVSDEVLLAELARRLARRPRTPG